MHDYGSIAARHYAAFRPPLHRGIVAEALGDQRFALGLDIGCGAGASTVALTGFCDAVIGTDPSAAMLAQAIEHPDIAYRQGSATQLPADAQAVDLVSAAGVLPYVDRPAFLEELRRVCRAGAQLLIYDFRVDTAVLKACLPPVGEGGGSQYDHSLSLIDEPGFETLATGNRRTTFAVTATEAAHLLLSNECRGSALADAIGVSDPFAWVEERLGQRAPSTELSADISFAVHRL
ncbi:MAG: class I SAM-dependent methyltransferase [Pseudomonadota bacterium]